MYSRIQNSLLPVKRKIDEEITHSTPCPKRIKVGTGSSSYSTAHEDKKIHSLFTGQRSTQKLALRTVCITPQSKGIYRSTKEVEYLLSSTPEPRPVTLVSAGFPIATLSETSDLCLALAVSEEQLLYPYKRNAHTAKDMDPFNRKKRTCKLLPASYSSIYEKLSEIQSRRISLYPEVTSGHYCTTGINSTAKMKPSGYFGNDNIAFNEVIISHYKPEHIMAIVITDEMPIIPGLKPDMPTLITALKNKTTLENSASLPEKPIIFYNTSCGIITGTYYLQELLPEGQTLQSLQQALKKLSDYCLEKNIPISLLNKQLWKLKPKQLLTQIFNAIEEIKCKRTEQQSRLNHQLVELACSGETSAEKYLELIKQGADIYIQTITKPDEENPPRQVCLPVIIAMHRPELKDLDRLLELFKAQTEISNRKEFRLRYCSKLDNEVLELLKETHFDVQKILLTHEDIIKNPVSAATFIKYGATITHSPEKSAAQTLNKIIHSLTCLTHQSTDLIQIFIRNLIKQHGPKILDEAVDLQITDILEGSVPARLYEYLLYSLQQGGRPKETLLAALETSHPEFYKAIKETINSPEACACRDSWHTFYLVDGIRNPEYNTSAQLTLLDKLFEVTPLQLIPSALDDLAQQVLDHYYRPIHPRQAMSHIFNDSTLSRTHHGIDHVVRTMRLNQALSELFSQYDVRYKKALDCPEMKTLLPLAMLYHDIVAEVEPKEHEETRAADIFTRDMLAAGYKEETVHLVANALRNKNVDSMTSVEPPFTADKDVPENERILRRLLRLPDSIDITRVFSIPEGFPDTRQKPENSSMFDITRLDLDPRLSANHKFNANFTELMILAVNLASVTGGQTPEDRRSEPNYATENNLKPLDAHVNEVRKHHIFSAPNACQSMDDALNDNIRRHIALKAERRISSDYELQQIVLPELTLLEKFQPNQPEVSAKLQPEIDRVRQLTFQRPTGTVMHDMLTSDSIKKKLLERGVELTTAQRKRADNIATVHVLEPLQGK